MYLPSSIPEEDRTVMVEKADCGHEVGIGSRPAVLIVDMTKAFVDDTFPTGFAKTGQPAVEAISKLMDHAREREIRGYYARPRMSGHPAEIGRWSDPTGMGSEDTGPDGGDPTALADGLSPTRDDIVLDQKSKPSMFFGTQLESMLSYDQVDSLIITGMTTSGCVLATVLDAFSYNYRVTVPEECVADRSGISHEVALFDIDMKYGDVRPLNDVLERLKV